MKQKRFGKKVQNWHRPLGRDQLRQRFLRGRYGSLYGKDDPYYYGQYWDYWDPDDDWLAEPVDLGIVTRFNLEQSLREVWERVVAPPPPPFRLDWAFDAVTDRSSRAVPSAAQPPVPRDKVGEILATHVENVHAFLKNSEVLRFLIADAIGDSPDLDVIKSLMADSESSRLATRICLFAPFWVRRPRTWGRGNERSLLEHLFVEYGEERGTGALSWSFKCRAVSISAPVPLPLAGRSFLRKPSLRMR